MTSTAGWTTVRARPADAARRDALIAAFFAAGAEGVHEDGDALVSHVAPDVAIDAMCDALRAADPDVVITNEPTPDVDWVGAWAAQLVPFELGDLTIVPPMLADGRDPATTVIIEPGMAFGTGDHPTTRGVVRLLPHVLRAGDVVADLGAGSAVLSIAATKLGASRVFAIEYDGEAIPNAEANVARNAAEDRIAVLQGNAEVLLPLVAPVRLVLANIISSVLVQLLPAIDAALPADGEAILSGILHAERDTMLAIVEAAGWRMTREDVELPWWSVAIARAAVA